MQAWAEGAAAFVQSVAQERAGGLAVSVRTIAHCGTAGIVAYSLLGERHAALTLQLQGCPNHCVGARCCHCDSDCKGDS